MEFNLDLYNTFNLDRKLFSLYLGLLCRWHLFKNFPITFPFEDLFLNSIDYTEQILQMHQWNDRSI